MRHEVKGKLLLARRLVADARPRPRDGARPTVASTTPCSTWKTARGRTRRKLDTYLEKARTHYAPSLEQRTERSLLTLLAVFQAALGAPRRREVDPVAARRLPRAAARPVHPRAPAPREGSGHLDARRARSARRLGEPPAAQRGLVAARLTGYAARACSGTGPSDAVPPSVPPSSGHSPLKTPQLHSKPGTTHACTIQTSVSSVLRPPIVAHSWRVDSSPATTTPPLRHRPPFALCWCQRSFGPAKPGGGPLLVVHEVAESDDLRVGARARRTTTPTGARDRSAPRGRCSCSARRCTARTPSTSRSRPPRRPSPSGTSVATGLAAAICALSALCSGLRQRDRLAPCRARRAPRLRPRPCCRPSELPPAPAPTSPGDAGVGAASSHGDLPVGAAGDDAHVGRRHDGLRRRARWSWSSRRDRWSWRPLADGFPLELPHPASASASRPAPSGDLPGADANCHADFPPNTRARSSYDGRHAVRGPPVRDGTSADLLGVGESGLEEQHPPRSRRESTRRTSTRAPAATPARRMPTHPSRGCDGPRPRRAPVAEHRRPRRDVTTGRRRTGFIAPTPTSRRSHQRTAAGRSCRRSRSARRARDLRGRSSYAVTQFAARLAMPVVRRHWRSSCWSRPFVR